MFWEPLDDRGAGVPAGGGGRRRRRGRQRARRPARGASSALALLVLADLVLQLLVVALGLALLFEPEVLTDPAAIAGAPSLRGHAVRLPARARGLQRPRRLLGPGRAGGDRPRAGCGGWSACGCIAASVPVRRDRAGGARARCPPQPGRAGSRRRCSASRRRSSRPGSASRCATCWRVSAVLILVAACNAAMLGLSRLGYSLALNRQIPSLIGYLHPKRSTPVVVIAIGAVLAIALAAARRPRVPGRHLRVRRDAGVHDRRARRCACCAGSEPDRDRPYKMPLNVRMGRGRAAAAGGARRRWLSAGRVRRAARAPRRRRAGSGSAGWRFGVALYVVLPRRPRTSRSSSASRCPRRTLTRARPEAEYGSILVPIRGLPLDDDIMQTAGRLAAEESEDDGEGGAVIEALWVFEVPMALPLDARVPDEELKRAARARSRGRRRWGRSTRASRSATADRARAPRRARRSCTRPGGAASRRSCWPPRSRRGSAAARCSAARPGLRELRGRDDPLRGQQGAVPGDPHRAARPRRASRRRARTRSRRRRGRRSGRAGRRDRQPAAEPARVRAVFVLVVGAGRVGLLRGHLGPAAGPHRLRARRGPALARAPRRRARRRLGGGRRALHDRHRAGDGRAGGGGHRQAEVFIASTNGDNTNLVVSQIAQRRFEVAARDRPHARPAARRLVPRAGPGDGLPDRRSRSSSSSGPRSAGG